MRVNIVKDYYYFDCFMWLLAVGGWGDIIAAHEHEAIKLIHILAENLFFGDCGQDQGGAAGLGDRFYVCEIDRSRTAFFILAIDAGNSDEWASRCAGALAAERSGQNHQ